MVTESALISSVPLKTELKCDPAVYFVGFQTPQTAVSSYCDARNGKFRAAFAEAAVVALLHSVGLRT